MFRKIDNIIDKKMKVVLNICQNWLLFSKLVRCGSNFSGFCKFRQHFPDFARINTRKLTTLHFYLVFSQSENSRVRKFSSTRKPFTGITRTPRWLTRICRPELARCSGPVLCRCDQEHGAEVPSSGLLQELYSRRAKPTVGIHKCPVKSSERHSKI